VRILINGGAGSRPKPGSGDGISGISKSLEVQVRICGGAGNSLVACEIGI